MGPPEVRYARRGESSIAYQALGEGPHDLIFVPGFVSQLELAWEEPHLARFLRELASFSRLIWFDKRGTGLSDPIPAEPSPSDRSDEILAVMDAAESRSATVFGVSEGATIGLLFALQYPERVSGLVTFAGFARLLRSKDHPFGWGEMAFQAFLDGLEETFANGSAIEFVNPSVAGDERYREWLARYLRAASSPGRARDLIRANADLDLRPLLKDIRVPTLVMHRVDEPWVSVEQSRYLAREIPGARLVELSGIDHWPWIGDSDAVVSEVESFVLGKRRDRSVRTPWGPDALTRREREVAELAITGLSARELAERLFISERTAESHVANIYSKLGVSSRVELIRRAREFGL